MESGEEERSALLNNGIRIPLLGFGVSEAWGTELETAVESALDCGYRHIDAAYSDLNEEDVGRGIQKWLEKSGSKREDLFVVTKLPMIGLHEGGVQRFLRLSLKKLNLAYVDLYLVHCPVGMKGKDEEDVFPYLDDGQPATDDATDLIALWKEMEKMVELGLARAVGVSNFSIKQLKKMVAIAKISPAVNQVELHVGFQQPEMVKFCQQNDIVLTAYAPLGSPGRESKEKTSVALLHHPVVGLVAEKHGVSSAQVLIRYWIQRGVVAIPKSVNPERIRINGNVFSFTLDEVDNAALLSLDRGEEGRTFKFLQYPGEMNFFLK